MQKLRVKIENVKLIGNKQERGFCIKNSFSAQIFDGPNLRG